MILLRIIFVLFQCHSGKKIVNHCKETEYKKPITDLEPDPEISITHVINDSGDAIYFCGSIKELFPQGTQPTEDSLLEIRRLLKMDTNLQPIHIWICINIYADRIANDSEIMSILKNDPNATKIDIQ